MHTVSPRPLLQCNVRIWLLPALSSDPFFWVLLPLRDLMEFLLSQKKKKIPSSSSLSGDHRSTSDEATGR